MVIYICDKCSKEFDRKSSYNYHINRFTPCNDDNNIININNNRLTHLIVNSEVNSMPKNANNAEINANNAEINANNAEINAKYDNNFYALEINDDNTKIDKVLIHHKYLCNYCNKNFTQIGTLKRHLLKRCKVRKEELQKQEAAKNNDTQEELFLKMFSELKEENNELKKMIMELAINAKANINNTNNGTIDKSKNNIGNIGNQVNGNVITNNNIKIEFGKEDLDKLSNDFFSNLDILSFLKSNTILKTI